MIAVVNIAANIWFCFMPFVLFEQNSESDKIDASLQMYKWVTLAVTAVLAAPTLLVCKWFFNDTRDNRKLMSKSYLFSLLWHIIRISWILGGSWLILGSSANWYVK